MKTASLMLLLFLLGAGCGGPPSRPRVDGKLTIDGKEPGAQTLVLWCEEQANETIIQRVQIKQDGTFEADVPVPGLYKVAVEPSMAAQESGVMPPGTMVVPQKYRNRTTSGLEWDLHPGSNQRDFDLR